MRFYLAYLVSIAVALHAAAQDTSLKQVKKAFKKADIPDDLELKFKPKALLEVTFPQEGIIPPITVRAGATLSKNATAFPPVFRLLSPPLPPHARTSNRDRDQQLPILSPSIGTGPFVIAVVDPDAPKPQDPKNAQFRHFLGGNFVLRQEVGLVLVNGTPAITEFQKPSPPDGSDAHRYVFLLYNQPDGFNDQKEVSSETSRAKFNVSGFAEKVGLGSPLGGTFMLVGPDEKDD